MNTGDTAGLSWRVTMVTTHLDLDGEGVDEVFWDAVLVALRVDAHGDELPLQANRRYDSQRRQTII